MITRICKQCGKQFEIEDGEIRFYQNKNLSLPKRCRECRELNHKSTQAGHDNKKNGMIKRASGKGRLRLVFGGICLILAFVLYLCTLDSGNGQSVSKEINTGNEQSVLREAGPDSEQAAPKEISPGNEQSVYEEINPETGQEAAVSYEFRNAEYLQEHYDKHGAEFGYHSPEEYLEGANRVICAEDVLHKTEAEDGDDVYYLERTNEFVILSTDGYIRTYFKPDDGIAYYDRQ